jgi:hypothetical protein
MGSPQELRSSSRTASDADDRRALARGQVQHRPGAHADESAHRRAGFIGANLFSLQSSGSRYCWPLREMSATLSPLWPPPCSPQREVWEPFILGTDLPAADIVLAARKSEADVVLLSLSSVPNSEVLDDLDTIAHKMPRAARSVARRLSRVASGPGNCGISLDGAAGFLRAGTPTGCARSKVLATALSNPFLGGNRIP